MGVMSAGLRDRSAVAKGNILGSWKEIANYAGRGVRTVQRWEAKLGFPVHRLYDSPRSPVLAFPTELDEWFTASATNSRSERRSSADNPRAVNLTQVYDAVLSTHLASISQLKNSLDILKNTVIQVRMQRAELRRRKAGLRYETAALFALSEELSKTSNRGPQNGGIQKRSS